MSSDEMRYREALERIAEAASAALDGGDGGDEYEGDAGGDDWDEEHDHDHDHDDDQDHGAVHGCSIKSLPRRLLVKAARRAVEINPANAVVAGPVVLAARGLVSDPLRIAVLTAKYWGPQPRRLTVSLMENAPADLRRRIVQHLNAWSERSGIRFEETGGTGQVRITLRGDGYWSYLGTDILQIPAGRPTMSLQGFSMRTPDSEFRRVVRHEAGHTLGFPHEHMRRALVERIDRERAYAYFLRTQGWDRRTVDQQVLTPLSERSIMATPADEDSIMCYQLPGEITRDRRPIRGGADINESDHRFAARIYPRPGRRAATGYQPDDWEERYDDA
jgi:hypothetical protein